MRFRLAPGRRPATAATSMVATSQAPATLAGLEILRIGGNAVDAAIAAAAALCVAEPMSTGVGGDAFALVWDGEVVHGLDASGPAPGGAAASPVHSTGPESVTVPGAVAGWGELSSRFGRLGLDTCLRPSIEIANRGVAAGYDCAAAWQAAPAAPAELGRPPAAGDVFRLPELARTLEAIADEGADAVYRGRVAAAIAAATWLEEADLAAFRPRWEQLLHHEYKGVEVVEMPAPTQGVAALEGLALLEEMEPGLASQVRAVSLALDDAFAAVRDGADVSHLLSPEHLRARLDQAAELRPEPPGGTVYLCVVDGDGMAVSFIQSLFAHFGSGVVAPGTGIVLNNRAAGFEVNGEVEAGARPYHTIIPGMLLKDGCFHGSFGVMGSYIQAQGHIQLVSAMVDDGLDAQAALDRPRFRIERDRVLLEEGLWEAAPELRAAGFPAVEHDHPFDFGGGQVILVEDGRILGGSDQRKDGFAAGF